METVAQPDTGTLAQRVRLRIYEHFVEHATPPVVEQLMIEFDLSRVATVAVLRELVEQRQIALVKGTARVLMAFPFSAIRTPFVVHTRGKTYFANCSWDSVAVHTMLGDDVRIESFCHHCAAPITIELSDGRATLVEPAETIIHLALRPTQWWEDIVTTCSNTMVFFCSADHRDAAGVDTSPEQAVSLTPDQVHALSGPLYGPRLELGYTRPGREALIAHFASLGLSGPYWEI